MAGGYCHGGCLEGDRWFELFEDDTDRNDSIPLSRYIRSMPAYVRSFAGCPGI